MIWNSLDSMVEQKGMIFGREGRLRHQSNTFFQRENLVNEWESSGVSDGGGHLRREFEGRFSERRKEVHLTE